MNSPTSTTKKHLGSCHCGTVKIEADLDTEVATRCNCTICTKLGCVGTMAKVDTFRVVEGEDALGGYVITSAAKRFFCKRCGVYLFGMGHVPEIGGDFVSVNLNVLDDIDPGLLSVRHWDGRHDNWMAGMRDEAWPIR